MNKPELVITNMDELNALKAKYKEQTDLLESIEFITSLGDSLSTPIEKALITVSSVLDISGIDLFNESLFEGGLMYTYVLSKDQIQQLLKGYLGLFEKAIEEEDLQRGEKPAQKHLNMRLFKKSLKDKSEVCITFKKKG